MADERCYVVRDEEGDYWGREDTEAPWSLDNSDFWRGGFPPKLNRLTREEARRECRHRRDYGHQLGTIVRLIPKRKPKAPREVFVLVHSHGGLDEDERPRTDRNEALLAAGSVQRVVRYVLAEGE